MSILQLESLRKTYRSPDGSERVVVDVPSFALEEKQQLALAGRSGSGKTTFLHLIAGILTPDSGRIVLGGEDMARLPESRRDRLRAERIGYVFQTFNLLQGFTALENVQLGMSFGKGADARVARELLGQLGLGDRLQDRPRQLSVGQQQRVALARALANRPDLVLADEPTGNLDVNSAGTALKLIRELCAEQGAALLLVSHDPDVLGAFETQLDFADVNRAAHAVSSGGAA